MDSKGNSGQFGGHRSAATTEIDTSTTDSKIAVMQAFLDGKVIELCDADGVWSVADAPAWRWGERRYRIKREPRELWVNVYPCGEDGVYSNLEDAEKAAACERVECIHYREVL